MKLMGLFVVLIFLGCDKKAELVKTKHNSKLVDTEAKIDSLEILDWKIGTGIGTTISKGVRLKVRMPILKKEDALEIHEKRKANSWLLRVKKITSSGSYRTLGYMYAPFIKRPPRSVNKLDASKIKYIHFSIYYAAAAPSKRFENFSCPAFGHNKYIDDVEIVDSNEGLSSFIFFRNFKLKSDPSILEITPVQFNGGMTLKGKYIVEIALYSSEDRIVQSNFVKLPQAVDVKLERVKTLPGCANFEPPPRDDKSRGKFKFGN